MLRAMAKANATWTVSEHGPLIRHSENLWSVEGPVPKMQLRRRMTIARDADRGLTLHNPIALDDASMTELEALGEVQRLVVPNGWHRLDSAVYRERYPRAQLVCPPGARKKVEEVVPVDATYEALETNDEIAFEIIEGLSGVEGVMRVRSPDGVTLVFNDLLFNVAHGPGIGGLVLRLLGSTGGPRVTRMMRLFVVKDRGATKAQLLRLAATPDLVRVIPGHGGVIDERAAEVLTSVADAL